MNEQIISALFTTAVHVRYYSGMVGWLEVQLVVLAGMTFLLGGFLLLGSSPAIVLPPPRKLVLWTYPALLFVLLFVVRRSHQLGEHTACARRWQGLHAEAQQLDALRGQLDPTELAVRLRRLADEQYALEHEEPLVYDKGYFEQLEDEVSESFGLKETPHGAGSNSGAGNSHPERPAGPQPAR